MHNLIVNNQRVNKILFLFLGFLISNSLYYCKKPVQRATLQAFVLLSAGSVSSAGKPVKTGDVLSGEAVIEVGPASICDLQIKESESGLTVRLRENTSFRLKALQKDGRLTILPELRRGNALFQVQRLSGQENVNVATPTAIASVRGTKFEIYIFDQGGTKTILYEGSMTTRLRNGRLENLPPELIENNELLQKMVETLEKSERPLEAGKADVIRAVVEIKELDEILNDRAIQDLPENPTPQQVAEASRAIDDRMTEAGGAEKIEQSLQNAAAEGEKNRELEVIPEEQRKASLSEFEEIKPVEVKTEAEAAKSIAERNQNTEVRKRLFVRLEMVTGGQMETLILRSGAELYGVIRQEGENYRIVTPEESMIITQDQVKSMKF